jgi:LytR cell envelope-related transcriptional attenuator
VRRYRTERRSPARATMLIVGGLVVGVAVLVVVLLSLGGGSKHTSSTTAGTTTASGSGATGQATKKPRKSSSGSSGKSATATVNPAETNVVVLNGTGTTGLAHRVSGELRQGGFTRSTALNGRPPGANQVTVVEYASGHQADAQSVAKALGVSQAQPIEGTVSSLAGPATVVVIVGLDKAATAP